MAVATGDIDRMVDFYTEALGAQLVSRSSWERGNEVIDRIVGLDDSAAETAMLRLGNLFLELFRYHSPPGRPADPSRTVADHGYTHFCLDVIDIDAEHERLSGLGMTFANSPPPATFGTGTMRSIYGQDPDGNVIELQEILDPDEPRQLL